MVATLGETNQGVVAKTIAIKRPIETFDLEEKLLSEISELSQYSFSEESKANLLMRIIPKLHKGSLKKAFLMTQSLSSKNELSKKLLQIDFIFLLGKTQQQLITKDLLKFLNQTQDAGAFTCIVENLVQVLDSNRSNTNYFNYILDLLRKIVILVKNRLDISSQFYLLTKVFKLFYLAYDKSLTLRHLLYYGEKKRFIAWAKSITCLRDKYFTLLGLLERFSLEPEEKTEISKLCIKVLKDIDKAEVPFELNAMSSDIRTNTAIDLESRIRLLILLPEQERKALAKEFYSSHLFFNRNVYDPNGTFSHNLTMIMKFAYCSCVEEVINSYIPDIIGIMDYLTDPDTQLKDSHYVDTIYFLISDEWVKFCNNDSWFWTALDFIRKIKSLETRAEEILLVLKRSKIGKFRRELLKEALATQALMQESEYKVVFGMELLRYLPHYQKKQMSLIVLKQIGCFVHRWYEFIVDSFAGLLVELTPRLRRECFKIIEREQSEINRIWFLLFFVPYLNNTQKERLLTNCTEIIDKLTNEEEKVDCINQLIRFGLTKIVE